MRLCGRLGCYGCYPNVSHRCCTNTISAYTYFRIDTASTPGYITASFPQVDLSGRGDTQGTFGEKPVSSSVKQRN